MAALYLITGVCGLVDAACFLSLGSVFAEIMTGNLLFFCFSIGTGEPFENTGKYLLVLAAFASGAIVGGRLERGVWEDARIAFAVEWALLAAGVLATITLDPSSNGPARSLIVAILAAAMGLQNALIRRHGVPDLATNAMTLTVAVLIAANAGIERPRPTGIWQRHSQSRARREGYHDRHLV